MEPKNKRHSAIKELVKQHAIEDQLDIVSKLQELYGIETNQSIVSRDLRTLHIAKRNVHGKMVYEEQALDIRKDIMRNAIVDIKHNESLIVIKTVPGLADFTAEFIDNQELPEIIGTLAGENTVFVVPASTKKIISIYTLICKKLFYTLTRN